MTRYFLICAAALSLAACSQKQATVAEEKPEAAESVQPAAADSVIVLADDELFRPGKAVAAPVVLDFNATWCIPCKKLAEPMEMAAKAMAGKAAFYTVDFEKNPKTAEAFGVTEVPCVIVLSADGSAATYPSLNDFISAEELSDPNADVKTIIYNNLTAKIGEALK